MIIQKLEIENFRSLKSVNIDCDDLIAILGRNGTGKSSVLYALKKFYDVSAQFTSYDYYNNDSNLEIKIRVTYGNLKPDELEEFSTYLQDGDELIVTKKINTGGARYYAVEKRIPEFTVVRHGANANVKRGLYKALLESGKLTNLPTSISSIAIVEEHMSKYEEQHPELCIETEMETQLFGPARIGGGKLDKYTKFLLIPAVRDVTEETQRRGAISGLLEILVERSVNNREDVRNFKEKFEAECKKIFNTDNLSELKSLGKLITENLNVFSPGAELSLVFGEASIPEISLPEAIPLLSEDKFLAPPSFSGHGLQRALIFALLRQLSLSQSQNSQTDAKKENEDKGEIENEIKIISPDLILAIEEPELYLHPSKCRFLASTLLKLSEKPKNLDLPATQIFYATHSPFFVDLDRFNQVNISKKIEGDGKDAKHCEINSYSLKEAADKMKEINNSDSIVFTQTSFLARTYPIMTSIVNEGYFSDLVVLVEGLSEVSALWFIQEKLNKKWNELNINIIPVGGKNNIDRPTIIFSGFKIKTYFIFDGDSLKKKKSSIKTNHLFMRLGNVTPLDFPDTKANEHFGVFNNDFETEIKTALGEEVFNEIRKLISDQLEYDDPSKVLKNFEGTRLFFEEVYNRSLKVEILEDIVNKITDLYNSN